MSLPVDSIFTKTSLISCYATSGGSAPDEAKHCRGRGKAGQVPNKVVKHPLLFWSHLLLKQNANTVGHEKLLAIGHARVQQV